MKPTPIEGADSVGADSCEDGLLKVVSWNLSGLKTDETKPLLEHLSASHEWDVFFVQEGVRSSEVQDCSHIMFLPKEVISGVGSPMIFLHKRWDGRVIPLSSGARWVAVDLDEMIYACLYTYPSLFTIFQLSGKL